MSSFSVISVMLLATVSAMRFDPTPINKLAEEDAPHDIISQFSDGGCRPAVTNALKQADATKDSDYTDMATGFCSDLKEALKIHHQVTRMILMDPKVPHKKGYYPTITKELMQEYLLSGGSDHEKCLKAIEGISARSKRAPTLGAEGLHKLAEEFCTAGEKFESEHATVFKALDEVGKNKVEALRAADQKGNANLAAQPMPWWFWLILAESGAFDAPTPPPPPCPYDFTPPMCSNAEAQTPRNLIPGAQGFRTPLVMPLNGGQAAFLPQTNVHFHYGTEHKSANYQNDTITKEWEASSLRVGPRGPRPGFMCPIQGLTAEQLKPYEFKHCEGLEDGVGKTYEVHYVHSSAGVPGTLEDGLGTAANGRGLLNPSIVVQGQAFQIVQGGPHVADMLHGWTVVGHDNSVMYSGSTTGTSFNNEVCSPFFITWHVDLECHQVSPESFDNMCREMMDTYGLTDVKAHGSRILVDPSWVVPEEYVKPLA